MTRYNSWLWFLGIVFAGVGLALLLFAGTGCTSSEKAIARAAVDVIQALCSPTATVQECADTILASIPDVDAGAD